MRLNTFRAFFSFQSKRFTNKRNNAVFLLLLLLSLLLVQVHIHQHHSRIESNKQYTEIEKIKVSQFQNYTQYGLYGFRVYFSPSPLSILFGNSGAFSILTANIDSGEKMNIHIPAKGKSLFQVQDAGFMDFSGIMLLLGTLFSLYTGFETFRDTEYLRFLASLTNHKKTYFYLILTHVLLLIIFFFLLTAASLLLLIINNIQLSPQEYLNLGIYFIVMVSMQLFFFFLGTVGSTAKSRVSGVLLIVSLWFLLIFFIPWSAKMMISGYSEKMTANSLMELQKLKILMNFERQAYQEIGVFKSGREAPKPVKKIAEGYWETHFKNLELIEEQLKKQIEKTVHGHEILSTIFPTTLYRLTAASVSSRGYRDYLDFYKQVQKLKHEFLRFYIDRKFYTHHNSVEPFIRGDENIYRGTSRLPRKAVFGWAVLFIYLFLGSSVSFLRFKKSLFPAGTNDTSRLDKLDIRLETGKTYVLLTKENRLKHHIYKFFSGQFKKPAGIIHLDDAPVVKTDFLYICPAEQIPGDIKVVHFVSFLKRLLGLSNKTIADLYNKLETQHIEQYHFHQLETVAATELLLAVARLKKPKIYLFHHLFRNIPPEEFSRFSDGLTELKKTGSAVFYITDDVLLTSRIGDSAGSLRNLFRITQ